MSNISQKQILEDIRKFTATKTASFNKAAIAGQDPASMPGSEHDSKTPEEALKPNKETRDGTMVPTSGLSTEGAGDDSPKTRGQALEADQAAETPAKKPLVTDDANAKTAEICNEILGLIRDAQTAPEASKEAGLGKAIEAGAELRVVDVERQGEHLFRYLRADSVHAVVVLGGVQAQGLMESRPCVIAHIHRGVDAQQEEFDP